MKKKSLLLRHTRVCSILILFYILFNLHCSFREAVYYSSATLLPGISREMRSPGFWINRCLTPDKLLLSLQEINKINQKLKSDYQDFFWDIAAMNTGYSGKEVREKLNQTFAYVCKQKFYYRDGKAVKSSFYTQIKDNMQIDNIDEELSVKFAFTLRYVDHRVLPTNEMLTLIPRSFFLMNCKYLNRTTIRASVRVGTVR